MGQLKSMVRVFSELEDSQKISELQEKQTQFIIKEYEGKIKRLTANEETTQTQLFEKESQIFLLKSENEELRRENDQLKDEMAKKTSQIRELIKTSTTLKISKALEEQKAKAEGPSSLVAQAEVDGKSTHYLDLESKLKEMEDCLNEEI
jgi:chromosome segregation ATPase